VPTKPAFASPAASAAGRVDQGWNRVTSSFDSGEMDIVLGRVDTHPDGRWVVRQPFEAKGAKSPDIFGVGTRLPESKPQFLHAGVRCRTARMKPASVRIAGPVQSGVNR